jgi:hypothetical protein
MLSFSHRYTVLAALLLICGCYHHPYQNRHWQGQPGYSPAQPGPYQTPGQLYVPPSNGTLEAPGTISDGYDPTPDDFSNSNSGEGGSFFPDDDDRVPLPGKGSSGGFNDDFPNDI